MTTPDAKNRPPVCMNYHWTHRFEMVLWVLAGYQIERCANCGLTRAEAARP